MLPATPLEAAEEERLRGLIEVAFNDPVRLDELRYEVQGATLYWEDRRDLEGRINQYIGDRYQADQMGLPVEERDSEPFGFPTI